MHHLPYFTDVESTSCNIQINGTVGNISSESSGISWVITAPRDHHIRLRFTTFQLSFIWWVEYRVQIYDGRYTNATSLGVFTGTRRPFTVQSSGQFMSIKLIKKKETSFLCNVKGVFTCNKTKGEQ